MTIAGKGAPVGARLMVRLATKRGGAGVRAVVVLRRGDLLARKVWLVGTACGVAGGAIGPGVGGGATGAAVVGAVIGGVVGVAVAAVLGRGIANRLVGKESRQVEGATLRLPDPMLLILDEHDMLHLVGLRAHGFFASLGSDVASWPVDEVTVASDDPAPGSATKPVRIARANEVYDVVLPSMSRQRAALELIESATLGRSPGASSISQKCAKSSSSA